MTGSFTAPGGDAEVLTGHLPEYGELLELLSERPGLFVVAGDPLSGTSALLATAAGESESTYVLCDARSCSDILDLAMAIGDAVVKNLAPEAEAWWTGTAAPASTAGLRVARAVSVQGIDLQNLQNGSGNGIRLLSDALELLVALDGRAGLLVDHLGLLLSSMHEEEARELLGALRSLRQQHPALDLVLVEHSGGMMSAALRDRDHPLFQAGQLVAIRRSPPARFAGDLEITRAWTGAPVEDLKAAAELAAGVPALTWRTLKLMQSGERPLDGWQRLREASEVSTAQQWDLLRRAHPQAQAVVAAMGVGLRPHAVSANAKSINEALIRLRGLGHTWQPQERTWSLANPLLKAWTRDHPPSWARRLGHRG